MVADWWAAMEAAERVRRLADWGLHVLRDSAQHEWRRIGKSPGATDLTPHEAAAIRAAEQRAAVARAEADNQMVELNASTLIAMVSATDALVEAYAPSLRELQIEGLTRDLFDEIADAQPEAYAALPEHVLDRLREIAAGEIDKRLKKPNPPSGPTIERWEKPLRAVGLGPPPGRPLPDEMAEALQEVIALRHVLVHRAGRPDARALKEAPTLQYEEGQLVRLTREDYKRYSAALWTYGEEVIGRLLGGILGEPPDLGHWQMNYTINA
jgi:hypothetical protein